MNHIVISYENKKHPPILHPQPLLSIQRQHAGYYFAYFFIQIIQLYKRGFYIHFKLESGVFNFIHPDIQSGYAS